MGSKIKVLTGMGRAHYHGRRREAMKSKSIYSWRDDIPDPSDLEKALAWRWEDEGNIFEEEGHDMADPLLARVAQERIEPEIEIELLDPE